jgi:hypothetical protein
MLKTYPLTLPALIVGLGTGVLVGLAADSLLCGFAILVLFVVVGATWRRDEAAIFPFVLGYQWIAVTVGYFYSVLTGVFPSAYAPGDVERTVWLSLAGLVALTAGIRITCGSGDAAGAEDSEGRITNLSGLFWLVIAVYAVNYLYIINTRVFPSIGVMLAWVMDFRQVLLLVLWFEILRRRTHFGYLWASLAWVFVPLLAAYFSDFKVPLFLLLIAYASLWRPWEKSAWLFSARQVLGAVLLVAALLLVALLWQAGVKYETRRAYDAETVGRDPLQRISLFVSSAQASVPLLLEDPQDVVEGLVERISYVTFFSRVLDYVPRVQPHTNGELLRMATVNAVTPRVLFPDKPELPSDSVYTRRFTGIRVPEEGTSISIGYMAEFYVDWGITGMFVMVFLYGSYMGLAHRALRAWVRPRFLINPALITALMSVYQFEHQFIKTFGALNLAVIVTLGMVFLVRVPLMTFLDLQPLSPTGNEALTGV